MFNPHLKRKDFTIRDHSLDENIFSSVLKTLLLRVLSRSFWLVKGYFDYIFLNLPPWYFFSLYSFWLLFNVRNTSKTLNQVCRKNIYVIYICNIFILSYNNTWKVSYRCQWQSKLEVLFVTPVYIKRTKTKIFLTFSPSILLTVLQCPTQSSWWSVLRTVYLSWPIYK